MAPLSKKNIRLVDITEYSNTKIPVHLCPTPLVRCLQNKTIILLNLILWI